MHIGSHDNEIVAYTNNILSNCFFIYDFLYNVLIWSHGNELVAYPNTVLSGGILIDDYLVCARGSISLSQLVRLTDMIALGIEGSQRRSAATRLECLRI